MKGIVPTEKQDKALCYYKRGKKKSKSPSQPQPQPQPQPHIISMDFDHHPSPLLNPTYSFYQQKSMEEMRQSLLLTMELQETRLQAEQDIKSRDDQIRRLKDLLSTAVRERDEAQDKCKKILFDNILLHRHLNRSAPPDSGISSVEDDPRRGIDSNNGFSSSDCDESIASSPQRMPPPEFPPAMIRGPLPERGKLLQAVVGAGPLLQTLLLAGPLPQWRHPPPPVDPYQIPPPPVVVPPSPPLPPRFLICGKRGVPEECLDWSKELKHPKISRITSLS